MLELQAAQIVSLSVKSMDVVYDVVV